jgi:hypothetical protein
MMSRKERAHLQDRDRLYAVHATNEVNQVTPSIHPFLNLCALRYGALDKGNSFHDTRDDGLAYAAQGYVAGHTESLELDTRILERMTFRKGPVERQADFALELLLASRNSRSI